MNLRSVPTFASGLAATGALMVASLRMGAGTQHAIRIEPVVRAWARAWLIPAGVQLEVTGLEHITSGEKYVLVPNHRSNLDSMVLLAALRLPLRFLAMRELFNVPLLGAALRRLGMIEVNREDPDSTLIERGVNQAFADGASIVVFAEGQTSHDGNLNRFRIGAFSIAIERGIAILPITLVGTREVWAPGSNAIHRGVVRIVIHEPIPTHGLAPQDANALRDQARMSISAAQGQAVDRNEI